MKIHSRKNPIHSNCRACGTNPKKIGLNPRALEINPRSDHPEFYTQKKVPKWLKDWDKSRKY